MTEIRNMPTEVLYGERELTSANLSRNREWLSRESMENLEKYLNDLSAEIEKRWQEIRNNKQ